MGYGDFKLLAALGAWLGWKMLLPIILIAARRGRGRRHRHALRCSGRAARPPSPSGRSWPRPAGSCSCSARSWWTATSASFGQPGRERARLPGRPDRRHRQRQIHGRQPVRRARRAHHRHRRDRARGRRARPAPARPHRRALRAGVLAAGRQPRPRGAARARVRGPDRPARSSRPSRIRRSAPRWNAARDAAAGPYSMLAIPLLVEKDADAAGGSGAGRRLRRGAADSPAAGARRLHARAGAGDPRGAGHARRAARRPRTTSS